MADLPPTQEAPPGPAHAAPIPSEDLIAPVLEALLRTCDLDRMTLRLVMASLAEHFQVDPTVLAPRKKFVRNAIQQYLENSYNPAEEDVQHRAKKEEDLPVVQPYENGSCSDSEEEGETKRAAGSKRPRTRVAADGAGKKVNLSNLEKAVILAEPLAEFLSELVLPRTHVARRISIYIKEKGLQDPKDRRVIRCDEKLKALFGTDSFTYFSVNKLTANLLYKVDEVDDAELKKMAEECNVRRLAEKQAEHDAKVARGEFVGSAKKKSKVRKAARASPRIAGNGAPRKKNGLTKDMKLSDALATVCGGNVMSRSQVVKQIWVYIKANNLQTKGKITCDEKLQAVFDGCLEVTNFGLNKYLSAHLTSIPES